MSEPEYRCFVNIEIKRIKCAHYKIISQDKAINGLLKQDECNVSNHRRIIQFYSNFLFDKPRIFESFGSWTPQYAGVILPSDQLPSFILSNGVTSISHTLYSNLAYGIFQVTPESRLQIPYSNELEVDVCFHLLRTFLLQANFRSLILRLMSQFHNLRPICSKS